MPGKTRTMATNQIELRLIQEEVDQLAERIYTLESSLHRLESWIKLYERKIKANISVIP